MVSCASLFSSMAQAADVKKDHVLLISIDGMHAVDYANCVKAGTCPTLATIGKTGINYTRTSTSRPSDSFPGLMALVTGGTPKSVGAFYDVAWDRVLAPPATKTGNEAWPPETAMPAKTTGHRRNTRKATKSTRHCSTEAELSTRVTRPSTAESRRSIPPSSCANPFSKPMPCAPVYPWNFIRTNTIYGVIHDAGGVTAWSDKHAVYAAVSGPTGTSMPSNLDDYYSPEVNSNQIPLPGITTAGTNFNCGTIVASSNDWTTDFQAIQCYDQLKANAVVSMDSRQDSPGRQQSSWGTQHLWDEFPGGERGPETDPNTRPLRLLRLIVPRPASFVAVIPMPPEIQRLSSKAKLSSPTQPSARWSMR